jgi:hypothetical protein
MERETPKTQLSETEMIAGLGLVVLSLAHYFAQKEDRDKLVAWLDQQTVIFERNQTLSGPLYYFREFVEAMRLGQMHSQLHRAAPPEQGPN